MLGSRPCAEPFRRLSSWRHCSRSLPRAHLSAVSQSGDHAAGLGGVEGALPRRGTEHERPVCSAALPNIVLIFPDNLGWGEVGAYGAIPGAPLPCPDGSSAATSRSRRSSSIACSRSWAALRRHVSAAAGSAPIYPQGRWPSRPLGMHRVADGGDAREPIFEAEFRASYGFHCGANHVLEGIRDGHRPSAPAVLVSRRVSDRRQAAAAVARGIAGWHPAGVISPLLSNIYLHVLDRVRCAHLGTLVRYADDFVVLCDTQRQVEEARQRVSTVLTRLGLELHPEKTRTVDLSRGRASSAVTCANA